MVKSANLGFPRIGGNRELKKALENYWKNNIDRAELRNIVSEIKAKNWQMQKQAGIDYIPSNDFSLYDHILDMIATVGAVPERFKKVFDLSDNKIDLDLYFAMARGAQSSGVDVAAMEMTKWFDTNYHYIVPEFEPNQQFKFSSTKIIDEYLEAKNLGIETRPVLIGPLSFLLLGKMQNNGQDDNDILSLLPNLLPIYEQIFKELKQAGVKDIQIDEPCLVTDLSDGAKEAYFETYKKIRKFMGAIKLHITTYFDDLDDNMKTVFAFDVDVVHIDLVRAPQQLERALQLIKPNQILSLGLINGRNIWITDLSKAITLAKKAVEKLGANRVIIAPSCSLLHSPTDLDLEENLDKEIKSWLCFAKQKLTEIDIIKQVISGNDRKIELALAANKKANEARQNSPKIHNQKVKNRINTIDNKILHRQNSYQKRKQAQQNYITLPPLPTTTIGSFPQTKEVRALRANFKSGKISETEYKKLLRDETAKAIKFQEEIGLDVLVHGEFERNDMVEYFGEQLQGFAFTGNGWVQSYGSRCVKPPIIFGDVWRQKPMTVEWISFAQSQTKKIMKGMLTGPITILQWSFVRDDQPRSATALQIAFAIRDEVIDLEKAGIKIIQIDEAALREGLPIHKKDWAEYLEWAVAAFKISSSGVLDQTQIHTHMCYSEFNDIIAAIAGMDADVISIETSRSNMELLSAFVNFKYPNDIGPGVYDIHSPRVPKTSEMVALLKKALQVLSPQQIWVNPDCGLKTRDWKETKEALVSMVGAAKEMREKIKN